MNVRELIAELEKLDPDARVCGHCGYGNTLVLTTVWKVRPAEEYHESLPEGVPYTLLEFDTDEKTPPPEEVLYKCRYCNSEAESAYGPVACRKCSWRPMMRRVFGENNPNVTE